MYDPMTPEGGVVKREGSVIRVKVLVENGLYQVDAQQVAEAILVRMLSRADAPAPSRDPQTACSKPLSSPSASANATVA